MKSFLHIAFLNFIFIIECLCQTEHFDITLAGGDSISTQTAGIPFFIEIVAKDSINGTDESFNGTVELSSTGILIEGSGTTNQFINGVLASHQVKFSNSGVFNFTVTQTSGTSTGIGNYFRINPGSPAVVRVETKSDGTGIVVPPQILTAGAQLFLYAVTRDTLNNFVNNQSGVSWSIQDADGGVQISDLTLNSDSSSAVFTGHIIGRGSIGARYQSLNYENSGSIIVTAGNASNLLFKQQPAGGTAGAPLFPNPEVQLTDEFGNFVSVAGKPISLSIPLSQGILNGFVTQSTNDSGSAYFNNLSINSIGEKYLVATAESIIPGLSDTFQLYPLIIMASSSGHGSIEPKDSVAVLYGSNQTFLIYPDTGYHLDSLYIDNIHSGSTSSFTFYNITTDHSIRAIFSINTYALTSSTEPNGTIFPSGTLLLNYGSSQSFSIIPDYGYQIDSVIIDGIFMGTDSSYLFTNINENHSIRSVFKKIIPVVNAKIFLQGCYLSGIMRTSISSIMPLTQPFNRPPWNYSGNETATTIPSDVVDWVLLELRSGLSAGTTAGIRSGFIKSNGMIVDTDGTSPLQFPSNFIGNYYIVIHHRNHIKVMSAMGINLTESSLLYDFTTGTMQYYGGKAAALPGGKFGMYAGDSSRDGFIDSDDFIGPDNNMFKSGYLDSDHSLDGFIDSDDFINPDNNMFMNSNVPD